LATASACSSDSDAAPASGEDVYRSQVADGNTFTCATCHALSEPADDALRRPGHPIGDAAARPSWKNGQVTQLREAVNSCLVEWMNAEPWDADDGRWLALEGFLREQAPASAPALTYAIVPPPTELTGGDAAAGRATFNGSCAVCHGTDGGGTERAPGVVGFGIAPELTAERVRLSGRRDSAVYPGLTGGVMPFWAADRLSDAELRDLVAYLAQIDDSDTDGSGTSGTTADATTSTSTTTAETTGSGSGCTADHPRVGQTATLVPFAHDVGGVARVVDDCTIEITNFSYDGRGVVVEIYGAVAGNYDAGVSLSDDLTRPTPYSGDTLRLTLPEGVTLDDIDGVSVWCVSVGVDFGSGQFQ
jgi:mono/diheme cytochrome c family protein